MLSVNTRVQAGKDRATVRYVGRVDGQDGVWVGVEWDDATRGKHDGSTSGVRYFECKSGPTAGSFVRIEKVNVGTNLLDALLSRYRNQVAEGGDTVSEEDLYVNTANNRRKLRIEVVGVEKVQQRQSQTELLKSARLVGLCVSSLGDKVALKEAAASLTDLDLSSNLIHRWDFVENLLEALPSICTLNLSDNRLNLASPDVSPQQLTGLHTLVLNNCCVAWDQLVVLEAQLPALQELHVCANHIARLSPQSAGSEAPSGGQAADTAASSAAAESAMSCLQLSEQPGTALPLLQHCFACLQVLSLEDNQIREWRQVAVLAALPCLCRLHLSNNPLTDLYYPDLPPESNGGRPAFAALQALLLGCCQLSQWRVVCDLDRFPALHELRINGNPLLHGAKSGGRFEVIGRVSRLTWLNGAEVKARERRDGELRYLQNVLAEVEDCGADAAAAAAIKAQHPRLAALVQQYGQVLVAASRSSSGPATLSSTMLEICLTCVAASAGQSMGSTTKKLPRSTTLAALKALCEKLFKVKAGRQALFVRVPGEPLPEPLTDELGTRSISAAGVLDGYEILIDELPAQ